MGFLADDDLDRDSTRFEVKAEVPLASGRIDADAGEGPGSQRIGPPLHAARVTPPVQEMNGVEHEFPEVYELIRLGL